MKSNLPSLLLSFLLSVQRGQPFGQPIGISWSPTTCTAPSESSSILFSTTADHDDELDTVRVRIWRILMENDEMSLKELSRAVNAKPSDVKFHLGHIEKQAKTLANKSSEWRERRGIPTGTRTVKVKKRLASKGKRNEVFIRLA
jgi:hypothetical protein